MWKYNMGGMLSSVVRLLSFVVHFLCKLFSGFHICAYFFIFHLSIILLRFRLFSFVRFAHQIFPPRLLNGNNKTLFTFIAAAHFLGLKSSKSSLLTEIEYFTLSETNYKSSHIHLFAPCWSIPIHFYLT